MASSHNIAQPMFGRAPAKNPAEGWSDGDALDFDLLAEYLLDDGNLNPAGVTFDFKYVTTVIGAETRWNCLSALFSGQVIHKAVSHSSFYLFLFQY